MHGAGRVNIRSIQVSEMKTEQKLQRYKICRQEKIMHQDLYVYNKKPENIKKIVICITLAGWKVKLTNLPWVLKFKLGWFQLRNSGLRNLRRILKNVSESRFEFIVPLANKMKCNFFPLLLLSSDQNLVIKTFY